MKNIMEYVKNENAVNYVTYDPAEHINSDDVDYTQRVEPIPLPDNFTEIVSQGQYSNTNQNGRHLRGHHGDDHRRHDRNGRDGFKPDHAPPPFFHD
jgi:hypothetical protein